MELTATAKETYETVVDRDERCVVERTADVIGGKWTTLILRELLGGTKRFGEIRAVLVGVSPKTLTDRLRELEKGKGEATGPFELRVETRDGRMSPPFAGNWR